MKKYFIKVKCEYNLEILAESEERAMEIANSGEGEGCYDLSDLGNFEYYIMKEQDIMK